MRFKFIPVLILCCALKSYGQTKESTARKTIESVAAYILEHSTFDFQNVKTKEVVKKVDDSNYSPELRIRSPFNTWNYWNGVLAIGMIELHKNTGEEKYRDFVTKNYRFAFDNYKPFEKNYKPAYNKWGFPFGQLYVMEELDDCGAMGAGLAEAYKITPDKEYMDYLKKAGDHILKKQARFSDGTLVRGAKGKAILWADDLYMSISLLSRLGSLTDDSKYFDDAIKQVTLFNKYLWNPENQLYYHCYYENDQSNGVAHWGRCNGWVMLAVSDLIYALPANHPKRKDMISFLERQIRGVSRYQSPQGLWHQLLDKQDSYLETSASAMYTYVIARAVNNGWIDKGYMSVAQDGWEGITTKIRSDGQVEGICEGTGLSRSISYYYERSTPLNDIHGLGAIILAGCELIKNQQVNSK